MSLLRVLYAILREIGDENAYKRYLATRGLKPSGDNWRNFSDSRMDAKYRKPKCC
jgi:hypothetical protein